MRYTFSYKNPSRHFLDIVSSHETNGKDNLILHLPSWRPGRYELGNFAKNVSGIKFSDEKNNSLRFKKVNKDTWEIQSAEANTVKASYSYYAAQPDAGSCYLAEDIFYINPVHCCLFSEEDLNKPCQVELILFKGFEVATSLLKSAPAVQSEEDETKEIHTLYASNFHELADSPILSSGDLRHHAFLHKSVNFHLWFYGECQPDVNKIEADFKKFISSQLELFKQFPFSGNDYHFYFLIHPFSFHHGVEHLDSTVIALGPMYEVFTKNYSEFLGISSHELFHAWNIKTIRPIEMMPYDYTKENYSRLGFVAEGVTTYYGDLILLRAGVFDENEYFKTLGKQLNKHFHNEGRFSLSVADSSFDTWLDGYVTGVPGRKVSIYTEGCLFALMLDLLIREKTENKKSLDDVMRILFTEFGLKKKGYSENDYLQIAGQVAGINLKEFFKSYCYGTKDFTSILNHSLANVGCEISTTNSEDFCEDKHGFKYAYTNDGCAQITLIAKASPARLQGLAEGDEIVSVNNQRVNNNLAELCKKAEEGNLALLVVKKNIFARISLTKDEHGFFSSYSVKKKEKITEKEKSNFDKWRDTPK